MPISATEFYGIENYRDPLQTEIMEYSTIEYLKWCFAKIGGFADANLNSPNNMDLLAPISSTSYRGVRSQWVYKTGLSGDYNPIAISGVYIDGTLQLSGYTVDYKSGIVNFTTPVNSASAVRVEHSYRTPTIHKVDEWFKQVQFTSLASTEFTQPASGIYNILAKNRIQLPAIVVHVPTKVDKEGEPYGIGTRTINHKQNTILYILTDNFSDNSKIHDILINQKPTAYLGLEKKDILEDFKNPLNFDGTLNSSGLMYPDLANTYKWGRIDVTDTRSTPMVTLPNFHLTAVNWFTEVLIN